jgi:hypothetical protein
MPGGTNNIKVAALLINVVILCGRPRVGSKDPGLANCTPLIPPADVQSFSIINVGGHLADATVYPDLGSLV